MLKVRQPPLIDYCEKNPQYTAVKIAHDTSTLCNCKSRRSEGVLISAYCPLCIVGIRLLFVILLTVKRLIEFYDSYETRNQKQTKTQT